MPRLNNEKRNQAIDMLATGQTVLAAIRFFGYTKKTTQKLVRRFTQRDSVRDRPRRIRPRVNTARSDGYIMLTNLCFQFLTATATAWRCDITAQIVQNCLRSRSRPTRAYWPYYGHILKRSRRAAK